MRINRVLALTASAALALGLAACGSGSDKDGAAARSTADTSQKANTAGGGSGDDFCTTAKKVYSTFDAGSLASGDPAALHDVASSFRDVAKSTDGDAATAWGKYADFIDLSADVLADPTNTDKASQLTTEASDATNWMTEISDSLASCS